MSGKGVKIVGELRKYKRFARVTGNTLEVSSKKIVERSNKKFLTLPQEKIDRDLLENNEEIEILANVDVAGDGKNKEGSTEFDKLMFKKSIDEFGKRETTFMAVGEDKSWATLEKIKLDSRNVRYAMRREGVPFGTRLFYFVGVLVISCETEKKRIVGVYWGT